MAAVSTATPTPLMGAPTVYPGWSLEETTESRVQQLMISKFTEIVADYDQRKECQAKTDLARGPWYANHYAAALRQNNHTARLEALIKRNAFYHGFPPKGFNLLDSPDTLTGKGVLDYQIQPNCLPTTALDDVRNGQFSFIDCGIAVELAMYATLREVFGDNRFNAIFNKVLRLRPNIKQTPLQMLKLFQNVSVLTPKPGDMVYFSNVRAYLFRHPAGEARGYNAICISPENVQEKKYIAFGTSTQAKTESEMYDLLIQDFNKEPIEFSFIYENKVKEKYREIAKELEAQFFQATQVKTTDAQFTRDLFESELKNDPEHTGLNPSSGIRLNIETIKEFLKYTGDS